jgi:hypothetical protein
MCNIIECEGRLYRLKKVLGCEATVVEQIMQAEKGKADHNKDVPVPPKKGQAA